MKFGKVSECGASIYKELQAKYGFPLVREGDLLGEMGRQQTLRYSEVIPVRPCSEEESVFFVYDASA